MLQWQPFAAIVEVQGKPPFSCQVYTRQRAGVFSFQQLTPPGIKPPQRCASPGNTGLPPILR
ncbi:hypothetical protein FP364_03410 [Citrobacter amalonaticus]|nr:hypothetical protein [Citrobacter amalonaticus]